MGINNIWLRTQSSLVAGSVAPECMLLNTLLEHLSYWSMQTASNLETHTGVKMWPSFQFIPRRLAKCYLWSRTTLLNVHPEGFQHVGPVDHPNNRWWTEYRLRSLLDRSHSLLLVQYASIAQVRRYFICDMILGPLTNILSIETNTKETPRMHIHISKISKGSTFTKLMAELTFMPPNSERTIKSLNKPCYPVIQLL